jgi:hypothetical protein
MAALIRQITLGLGAISHILARTSTAFAHALRSDCQPHVADITPWGCKDISVQRYVAQEPLVVDWVEVDCRTRCVGRVEDDVLIWSSVSYSCFFAAFDMTRRMGLRVKAFFGGSVPGDWGSFITLGSPTAPAEPSSTPTVARVAQATTIVTGGVIASLAAEMAGRPFKACQRMMQQAKQSGSSTRSFEPIVQAYRSRGLRPFLHPNDAQTYSTSASLDSSLRRSLKRVGWRLAAVGPWGMGFLVWAWVGGEV